jgi:hypothetical protein
MLPSTRGGGAVMTLNQLFDGFMLAKEADGVQDTTLKMYRWMIRT